MIVESYSMIWTDFQLGYLYISDKSTNGFRLYSFFTARNFYCTRYNLLCTWHNFTTLFCGHHIYLENRVTCCNLSRTNFLGHTVTVNLQERLSVPAPFPCCCGAIPAQESRIFCAPSLDFQKTTKYSTPVNRPYEPKKCTQSSGICKNMEVDYACLVKYCFCI